MPRRRYYYEDDPPPPPSFGAGLGQGCGVAFGLLLALGVVSGCCLFGLFLPGTERSSPPARPAPRGLSTTDDRRGLTTEPPVAAPPKADPPAPPEPERKLTTPPPPKPEEPDLDFDTTPTLYTPQELRRAAVDLQPGEMVKVVGVARVEPLKGRYALRFVGDDGVARPVVAYVEPADAGPLKAAEKGEWHVTIEGRFAGTGGGTASVEGARVTKAEPKE